MLVMIKVTMMVDDGIVIHVDQAPPDDETWDIIPYSCAFPGMSRTRLAFIQIWITKFACFARPSKLFPSCHHRHWQYPHTHHHHNCHFCRHLRGCTPRAAWVAGGRGSSATGRHLGCLFLRVLCCLFVITFIHITMHNIMMIIIVVIILLCKYYACDYDIILTSLCILLLW